MRQTPRRGRRKPAFEPARLELLEERRVFAVVIWDGGGGDMAWNNPLNWSGDTLPTSVDSVSISAQPGLGPIRVVGAPARAHTLTTHHDIEVAAGALLRVDGSLQARPGSDLTVAGQLVWRGGEMDAGGLTVIAPGGLLTIETPSAVWIERRLLNEGTIDWTMGTIYTSGPEAVLEIETGGVFRANSGDTRVSYSLNPIGIVNRGTILSLTSGVVTLNTPVQNRGTIEARHGTVELTRGGVNSGTIRADVGASVVFRGVDEGFAFQNGTLRTGGGVVRLTSSGNTVSGHVDWGTPGLVVDSYANALRTVGATTMKGTLRVIGFSSVAFDHSVRIMDTLDFSAGRLDGSGDVWVHGRMVWGGATLGGSGTVRMQRGSVLDMNSDSFRTITGTRQIWNNGVANWDAGSIWIETGVSAFQNLRGGRFNADSRGGLVFGDGRLINKGFFEVDVGSGQGIGVTAHFSNLTQPGFGGVKIVSGTLALSGDVPQFSATGTLTYGLWSINSGAAILTNPTIRLTWSNAFVTLQGSAVFSAIGGLERNHGTLTLDRTSPFLQSLTRPFTNSGTLVKQGSGNARIDVPFVNTGTLAIGGPAGAGASIAEFIVNAGSSEFVNRGSISVASRARLQVIGDYRQTAQASLTISASGTADHEVGRVWVRGASTLGGRLVFQLESGLVPAGGQIFTFLRSDQGRTGSFGTVVMPSLGNGMVAVLSPAASGLAVRIAT